MEEYWSRGIQMQVWCQCLNVIPGSQPTNYRENIAAWVTKLRHLEVPKLSEEEIVKNIANHYPGYLKAIFISLPERKILNAMKLLSEEENRRPKKDNWSNRMNNRNNRKQRTDWRNNQREQPNNYDGK